MSKYLKLFETTSQYNEYITSIDVVLPNVSVAKDAPSTVYFNPLPHDYSEDYLTLTALGDGEITITIPSNVNATYASYLSYSKDKSNWVKTAIDGTSQTIKIPVSIGEDVYLKGIGRQWGTFRWSNGSNINSSADIVVSGNVMSLLYGDSFKNKTAFQDGSEYIFMHLFKSNKHLINADNLILPATTLTPYCYYQMFYGCSSLTTAPDLPASTLATYCYSGMFDGCTLLTSAPELPATMLASCCYYDMCKKCSSLTTAPELPATTLSDECYQHMFDGCTSLTTAPELNAMVLASSCYSGMFDGCTSLTTAPELPATTLDVSCYENMFRGCSKLNSITMLATDISAANCLFNWVEDVASTGTLTKAASMTSLPTGTDGIPTGWTVIDK